MEKRYNNLAKINCYDCRDEAHGYVCGICHKETLTTHVDKGVTSFCIRCDYCGGAMMHKNTYRKGIFSKGIKIFEFRRSPLKEMLKGGEGMIRYVLDGGLVLDRNK